MDLRARSAAGAPVWVLQRVRRVVERQHRGEHDRHDPALCPRPGCRAGCSSSRALSELVMPTTRPRFGCRSMTSAPSPSSSPSNSDPQRHGLVIGPHQLPVLAGRGARPEREQQEIREGPAERPALARVIQTDVIQIDLLHGCSSPRWVEQLDPEIRCRTGGRRSGGRPSSSAMALGRHQRREAVHEDRRDEQA